MFGEDNLRVFSPSKAVPPYTHLIKAAIEGARHLFVPSEILYKAWKFWDPLIETSQLTRPRSYLGRNKDPERLEFVLMDSRCQGEDGNDGGVRFTNSEQLVSRHGSTV